MRHTDDRGVQPTLTEEMVLNEEHMGKIKGWRRFRVEYEFEGSTPEGVIYLPPGVDPDEFERFLQEIVEVS